MTKYKMMPYKALIKEHENLVKVLKNEKNPSRKLKKLLDEQSQELKEYKEEYKKKNKK